MRCRRSLYLAQLLSELIAPLENKDNSQQLPGHGGERYVGCHCEAPISSLNETFESVYNGSCTLS